MRTLKLQVQTTVDGYMSGPNGEMDWMTFPWTPDLGDYITALTASVDCILLGRRLAEGFIPHWAARPEHEPGEAIDKMNDTPKVVVSNTLSESPWANTVVAGGDLAETVNRLKDQPGGDIIVYGGGTLVANLIAAELIDELNLFVNPTAIGAGLPVFPTGAYSRLELVSARGFDCGVSTLRFTPRRA